MCLDEANHNVAGLARRGSLSSLRACLRAVAGTRDSEVLETRSHPRLKQAESVEYEDRSSSRSCTEGCAWRPSSRLSEVNLGISANRSFSSISSHRLVLGGQTRYGKRTQLARLTGACIVLCKYPPGSRVAFSRTIFSTSHIKDFDEVISGHPKAYSDEQNTFGLYGDCVGFSSPTMSTTPIARSTNDLQLLCNVTSLPNR